MEIYTEYSKWIHLISGVGIIIYIIYLWAGYELQRARARFITAKERQAELREKIIKINRTLIESGMNYEAVFDFWEECLAEAQIQYSLPPCRCDDINQCDTWCQAKARFSMNPPDKTKSF